ncbi:acyl-CoA thioesterase [Solimonas sp. K1W22B-7]|uniref:acyl-CoA thioesterase n=1 Tax=Solimonas sp. K1W22B-7 TaxID=2303331 RepID=UPI000E332454|nr:thioesterase family protein [Solimonas sp. K1W22B-7]AXQ28906.1 acyl-CoA thioesterase [Solimonas sp. K1W22B-7]
MFTLTVSPRFYETDAFGHINNTVMTGWFETAREPVLRIFSPDFPIRGLTLILARIEVDFVAQTYFGHEVSIRTSIEKLGNSSFVVLHEAWQKDKVVARGKAVMVAFDFDAQKSVPIPAVQRAELEKHLAVPSSPESGTLP